jgi:hypothetical protein
MVWAVRVATVVRDGRLVLTIISIAAGRERTKNAISVGSVFPPLHTDAVRTLLEYVYSITVYLLSFVCTSRRGMVWYGMRGVF